VRVDLFIAHFDTHNRCCIFCRSREVRARHLPGPVPLELVVETEAGTESHLVTLPPTGAVFTLELPARARGVELNEDRGLLVRRIEGL
jgi:hypothetical protein